MASQIIGPSGTPPTQPVTGPLTDTQLRASPVPVSGTVTATTGGLTDTQLRATPVPVSGTVTANAGTNLNTSTLALESGGHLATIDTSTAATAAVEGTTAGAKVITDANGTIQQYLRGLIYQSITAGAFLVTAALSAGTNLIGYVGFKSTYAGKVTLTTTNWVSLTNTSGWQSASITTNGARDLHLWLETQSTGTAYCDFYIATKLSTGTGFTDGATGTEGTFTAANRLNSRYIGSVRINNGQAQGEFCLSDIFRGAIPALVAIIGINNSGATINATGSNTVFEYELVN